MADLNPKNQKLDVQGRSLLLNSICILLNLIGVFFIVKGFHISAAESGSLYKILGFSMLFVSLGLLVVLKGIFLFSYVARALVGGLFIVSGLIKANDPWGFAFKLEEYFAADGLAFDYPFFEQFTPYALHLSILISVAEIILGVAVIVGGKIKLAAWSLVIMMGFFTWLTWYTTSCNDKQIIAMELGAEFNRQCVTDCGCFGDAMRGSVGRSLSPIESFWKDLTLFYFVLIIFINQWKIRLNQVKENWLMVPAALIVIIFFSWVFTWMFPIFFSIFTILGAFIIGNLNIGSMGKPWKMAIFTGLVAFIFSLYTSMYLPIKDYRPYKIGNNIREQMNMGVAGVSEFIFQYEEKATGKIIDFKADQWEIYTDTTKYKYHDRIEKVISEGVDAPIKDFSAGIDYARLTEEEKAIPYIDSLIKSDYDFFYEEKMVLKHAWGADTIAAMEYDTLYYPDSVYTKVASYVSLIDPSAPFSMDLTDYILNEDAIFVMTMRDITTVGKDELADIKAVYVKAKEQGIPFVVLTPATAEQINQFKTEHDFSPMFLSIDGTEVKIIIRSNPGLLLIKKATVIDMWPWRSVPDFEDIYSDYLK
jgi:uncharacterized membrane protein YphA (DoxX/SURF4 family)